MRKRLDGIYRCWHPDAYVDTIQGKVVCPDCPYEPRPSTIRVGGLISVSTSKQIHEVIHIDRDGDRFIVLREDT